MREPEEGGRGLEVARALLRRRGLSAFLALAYFSAIVLANLLPSTLDTVLAIWPAGGIGLAAVLLAGRRRQVAMAGLLFLAGYLANLLIGKPPLASLGYMTANALESLLCALVMVRLSGTSFRLDSSRGVFALFFAALVVNAGTALLGASTASLTSNLPFLSFWFSWWVGDGLSILAVAPLVLSLFSRRPMSGPSRSGRSLEYLAFFVIWLPISWLTFNPILGLSGLSPHPYILIALLVWPAARLGPRSLAVALFALVLITVSGHVIRFGPSPLHGDTEADRLVYAQFFLLIASFMAWLLQANYTERRTAELEEREDHERLKSLEDNLPEGLTFQLVMDRGGGLRFAYLSRGIQLLTGHSPEEVLTDPGLLYSLIPQPDRARMENEIRISARDLEPLKTTVPLEVPGRGGRWIRISASPRSLTGGGVIWDGIQVDMTDLVEAQTARESREHQIAALLEQAADGIFISDAEGRFAEVNAAGCAMLGLPRDELLGAPIGGFIVEEPESPASTPSLPPKEAGGVWRKSLRRRDGSVLHAEINTTTLSDGRTIGVVRDIGDRKWQELIFATRARIAEASLTEHSESELLRLAIDTAEEVTGSAVGFFHLLSDDEKRVTAQQWSTRTIGPERCEARSDELHLPIERAGVWAESIRRRRPVIHNDYASLPDRRGLPEGHAPLVRELVVPVIRKSRIVAVIGVGNRSGDYDASDIERVTMLADLTWDVIERRRTEIELRESEERFSTIFRDSPIPSTLTRMNDGSIIDMNDAYLRLFGYTREELLGKTVLEIGMYLDASDRDLLTRTLGAEDHGRSVDIDTRLRKKSGEVIEANVISEVVHFGGEHYLIKLTQDITERRRAEREIARALAEKEVLLRELYHRSNNNMQVISAILEFQASALEDDRLSKALGETQERIGSIALVNRKLYEAQDLSHVNLRAYIRDLADMIVKSQESRAAAITLEEDLEEVWVLVDSAIPCGLILNELIVNVFKHAYPAGRSGPLSIRLAKDGEGLITLRVADRGVGLPAGMDIRQTHHVGIASIVNLCAAQLRGTLQFDTLSGLACEIRFKDNIYEARI